MKEEGAAYLGTERKKEKGANFDEKFRERRC